jgi:hypothetical protein
MGEAKRRRRDAQTGGHGFARLDAKLRRLGIDTAAFGFYDQPAFVALEQANPRALELYSAWVLDRPRDAAYERHARETVPRLAAIVERRLAVAGGLGACVNVATMMARMLDRLGIWSFAVRGSLTIEIPSKPEAGKRYFPECDLLDKPENVTGHGWLVAPPFLVVDPTLRHQSWVGLHPAIELLLPAVVAADDGQIVRPRWDDVVSDLLIAQYQIPPVELTVDLPYQFKPDLAQIEKSLPGRDIRIGELSLRYIPGSVTVSDRPLEQMRWVAGSSPDLCPIDIWNEDVRPKFPSARA